MMTRLTLLAGPCLMALIAFAGEPTIEELVKNLGAEDYSAREDATRALIARGAAAIPALEKAVQDKDVEVRMRAGRALRAIREKPAPEQAPVNGQQEREAAPGTAQPRRQPQPPGGNGTTHRSTSMRFDKGEWTITITSGVGAEKTTKTYRGKSLEELKKKHPEVREALGGTTFRFGNERPGGKPNAFDPFKDFDKWFEQNGFGNRRRGDPFGGAADLQKEIARLNQWARWLAQERARRGQVDPRARARQQAETLLLGIRARKPETVLDAQLQLRGRGLVIEKVEVDTLAARLGLQRYDILLELNGITVRTAADIRPTLLSQDAKQPVRAKVMRRAKLIMLKEAAPTSKAK